MPVKSFRLLFVALVVTQALGWPDTARSHETVKTTITYEREVSQILVRRCVSCHNSKGLSFPLTTYEATRPWARAIEEEILSRQMPPWRAVAGYGRFANDGALTTRELQTLIAWIEGNGPKTSDETVISNIDGDAVRDLNTLEPAHDRWQLNQPDVIRQISVTAAAVDRVGLREVVSNIAVQNPASIQVSGLEFKPDDHRGLRGATFSLEGTGQWLGSWAPWFPGVTLPAGTAYTIPSGSRIVARLYYEPGTAPLPNAGSLGLTLAPSSANQCPADVRLTSGAPATVGGRTRIQGATTLRVETTVLALVPELDPVVRSLEVRAKLPDGSFQALLMLNEILHDWPTPYVLAAPAKLPAGTEVSVIGYGEGDDRARPVPPAAVALRLSAVSPGACVSTAPAAHR
jgi:hypothetical protein